MSRKSTALLLALLAGATVFVSADEACGEHGHLEGQVCVCDNPWPDPKQRGWTGKNCTLPVWGAEADGQDLTAWCHGDYCHSLDGGAWGCFALKFAWNRTQDPWNYLSIQMNRTSPEGDPDLFGIFTGGARGLVVPNTTAKGYDFQETSSGRHALVGKQVKKADFGADHDYEGAYLCVRSYGTATTAFALRATLDRCPSSFAEDGTPLMCHTPHDAPAEQRRYSECTAAGECVCTGEYAKPVPEVYAGLGFEDCTARVAVVEASQYDANATFMAEHQTADPDTWRFYRFKVRESDYQVVVNLAEEDSKGRLDMYVKYGAPPNWGPHQFDLRPDWNAALDDRQLEVSLDPTKPTFRAGLWYVGVVGDHEPANYTLTIARYECPLNCSGHGECIHGAETYSRQCQCREGYGGVDCSLSTAELSFGATVEHKMRAFEYDYYTLPNVTEGMQAGNVEVVVEASYYSDGYHRHLDIFPALLLAPAGNDSGAFPTASSYAYKLALDAQNVTRRLTLCPSQLREAQWKLAVYNPMRVNSIAYNLTLLKEGRCLNNCSDHGTCTQDGICECQDNWSGGDCSVSLNASCLAGTRRAAKRPDQRGTCWQECACDEAGKECSYGDACVDFTCDAVPEGQVPLRRKGNETECVQDHCVRDLWEQTPDYVCLKNCTCPADGGPCALAPDCSRRVAIGGGRQGHSGGAVFGWALFSLLLGAAAVLGYIHMLGVPYWLPIRNRGFGGLYQELSEEGV